MHSVYKISGEVSNERKLVVACFVFHSEAIDWATKKNKDESRLYSITPVVYVVEEGNGFAATG